MGMAKAEARSGGMELHVNWESKGLFFLHANSTDVVDLLKTIVDRDLKKDRIFDIVVIARPL